LNAVLAQHTHHICLGALVHVLTTWHPLHFAEDYALADVLAGGRRLCGLGRGTEERESHVFGVNVGYSNNADDRHNRAVFEEQIAIFKAATANERFAYRGTYYTIPPEGLTFRGAPVTEIPLVPRPLSSEATLCYAARQRHVGVFANHPWEQLVSWWQRYGSVVEEAHGVRLRPGEDRLLVVQLHLADSAGEAIRTARPGHDELTKLLWPNIIRRTPALAEDPPAFLDLLFEVAEYAGRWLDVHLDEHLDAGHHHCTQLIERTRARGFQGALSPVIARSCRPCRSVRRNGLWPASPTRVSG
jgi:alkanesulfonate monooxygenase SsuD/methylene tetrahydromethanopterin reductase-like flavin-dependent oxidoreductase (luciferase family)